MRAYIYVESERDKKTYESEVQRVEEFENANNFNSQDNEQQPQVSLDSTHRLTQVE